MCTTRKVAVIFVIRRVNQKHPSQIELKMFFPDSDGIKMFVLDEADEMLSRGFRDQIYEIFQELPMDIQVMVLYVVSQMCTLL